MLGWIRAFLKVSVNGVLSEPLQVTSGVLQGNVLGPTLLLVYVNDMSNMLNFTIKLFADDTKLPKKIHSEDDRQCLQANINQMFD